MSPRPLGITILALLHTGGGFVGLFVVLAMAIKAVDGAEPLQAAGIPPVLLVIGAAFITVTALVSGVGMWLGRKWGWWTAAFYYLYSILRNSNALFVAWQMRDGMESADTSKYLTKFGARVIIHLLILLYLFISSDVLEYFELGDLRKGMAFLKLVGVVTAIGSAATLYMFLT